MKVLKQIPYSEVSEFFAQEHPIDLDSPHFAGNKWGLKHLEWANEVAKGEWSLCELDSKDILGIVFSHHAAEETGEELVGEKGMTLTDATKKLRNIESEYAKNNPTCWAKMMYWQGKDFSPIFLSTKPTMEGKGRRSLVDPSLGSLFHQDGLHRLLRWNLDGRFEDSRYLDDSKLTAYISGSMS
ncbi:MAG: hypothetical protein JWN64_142 [Parcubacteria group bacterium]|nr:hypothetical protein [Parcubacteria group bacterium]